MEYKSSLYKIKEAILNGKVEKKLDYIFNNKELLLKALTHKSYTYYFQKEYTFSNERLEFLGDAVLGLIISEILMEKYPDYHEGTLTKIKSHIVSEATLASVADNLNLQDFILLGKSEFTSNNHNRNSIVADAVEALIGAIYIDSNLEIAKNFILKHFSNFIKQSSNKSFYSDYKSLLQEIIQKKYKIKPVYTTIKEEGPEHKKVFFVKVIINGKEFGEGQGKNKKEAEQNAAHKTLEMLES